MTLSNFFRIAALIGTVTAPATAFAGPNLVVNGDFEQTSMADSQGNFTPEQMTASNVSGWSTNGYNFIFGANTATTVGSNGIYGQLTLYDGSAVSGGAVLGSSPTGGHFVGADGAFDVDAISQTLNGLTRGSNYAVSFDWAGAQQSGYNSPTTEQWQVSLGNETLSTAIANNLNHGFTGWMHQTLVFQATGPSEVLSFLSNGTPTGEPPFALLDGVSATDVPEPASLAFLALGAGIVSVLAFRRRAMA